MKRKECEDKILEKLKEIREIAKKYDKNDKIHLSMSIIDNDYIACFSLDEEFPLDCFLSGGVVIHCDN